MLSIMIMHAVSPTSWHFRSYSVTANIMTDGMVDVHEILDVDITSINHGIFRTIPLSLPGWASPHISVSRISVRDHEFTTESYSEGKRILMGDPDSYVSGNQTYDLTYRLSALLGDGVYSMNVVGFDWDQEIYDLSFSVTFPRELDRSAVRVYAGSKDTQGLAPGCRYSVDSATVHGTCSSLDGGVTVTVPVSPFYFRPRTAQLIIMCVAVALDFVLGAWMACILYRYQSPPVTSTNVDPVDAGVLLFGKVPARAALLACASRGRLSLERTETDDVSATVLCEAAPELVDGALIAEIRKKGTTVSGDQLIYAIYNASILNKAIDGLIKQGYYAYVCWGMLTLFLAVGVPLLALTEFARAYQTPGTH
jgi:hypothetical protein